MRSDFFVYIIIDNLFIYVVYRDFIPEHLLEVDACDNVPEGEEYGLVILK